MAAAKKTVSQEETTAVPALVPIGGEYVALNIAARELQDMIGEYLEGGLQNDDLEQIRVPTGGGLQWEMPSASGGEMVGAFEGVIVAIQTTRSYWPEAFNGAGVPPDCSSRDGKTGKGIPGGACEPCEKNQWGSGKNGVGMACAERKRVYVLRPEGFLPIILSLPVTSIRKLRQYQLRLLSQRTPPHAVVTKFSLERTKSKAGIAYSQVVFMSTGGLTDAFAALAKAYAKAMQSALGMQPDSITPEPAGGSGQFTGDGVEIPESDPPFGPFGSPPAVGGSAKKADAVPF